MSDFSSSVSPKGQVTIPAPIRERLGVKPKDRVVFRIEGDAVRIEAMPDRLASIYGAVPPLAQHRAWREIEEIAHEEHAAHVAREGIDDAEDDR